MEKKRVFITDEICRQDENGKYKLYGSICKKCGHKTYPSSSFCTSCLSQDLEPYDLAEEGEIYTYTIIRVRPPYGHYPSPHPLAYVDMPESEARVMAPLYMEQEDKFHVGAKVKLEFADYWEEEDKIVFGPKFRIVEEGGNEDA